MRNLLVCLAASFLVSCGSYTLYRTPAIKSVLAVTETGDTIAVPYRQFQRERYDNYTRFEWNNRWYWNNWRYHSDWGFFNTWWGIPNNVWVPNPRRYSPSYRQTPKQKYRPRNPRPKIVPKSYNATPRGRRSYENRSRTPNTTRNVTPQSTPRSNSGNRKSNNR